MTERACTRRAALGLVAVLPLAACSRGDGNTHENGIVESISPTDTTGLHWRATCSSGTPLIRGDLLVDESDEVVTLTWRVVLQGTGSRNASGVMSSPTLTLASPLGTRTVRDVSGRPVAVGR